jgi:hypothetical protein
VVQHDAHRRNEAERVERGVAIFSL